MRHRAIILLAALAPLAASAQQLSEQQTNIVESIAQCLLVGLPEDWQRAEMTVVLPQTGAAGGEVTYRVSRAPEGRPVPFRPCDDQKPAQALVDMRRLQTPELAAWSSARLVIHREGKFDLKYDYPGEKK
jgi:hypothetical protein